ncbi:hypothetical protein DJ013_06620 [Arcticibacterium luteifluviistationis]|uniref:Uncharacterized protein n=2 Tax=Arcticibacterium luteifluviistationis TaxID=1784714 RepID=A0A2Z4GHS1_9BACT|nr:hypothetical protein DJ013_06620 [Arcticibacterium luteifluviistationis]
MGGQKAFDEINNISWNFFNARTLTWNKNTGDVRIDHRKENTVFLYNTETKTGRVLKNGVEYTQQDSLDKYLNQAYEQWVNDSYWLVMPFKLDDPGVTLTYVGKMKSESGANCDVLQMTFNEVGVTPQNKYLVYIDEKTSLVSQWDYFPSTSDAQPRFSTPWLDYKTYGNVKLSGDRGNNKITDIHVFKYLKTSVYTEFKRPSFIK